MRGEGIFVNSRRLHSGYSDDHTECEYYVVLFHPATLCSVKQLEHELVTPVINSTQDFIHLRPDTHWHKAIIDLVNTIAEKSKDKTAPFAAFGSVYLIWSEIAAHVDLSRKPGNDNTKLSELKAMISYIHEYYSQKVTLEAIAQSGYVSKRTCGGLFLKYLYKTPIEYLNDYRLQKSIELMKSTDKTILEISLACGFSGASYYAEVFRRSFGTSPAEYRKKLT